MTGAARETLPGGQADRALPPTAAVPTPPSLHEVSYGAHVQLIGLEPAPILNALTAMHFDWVAQTVYWRDIERQPGQYDWSGLDALLDATRAGGYTLRLLLIVRGTPDWARPAGADLTRDGPPADTAALAAYLRALAGRYAGRVAAYEIYPEANDAQHWASPEGLSPRAYADLLAAAATAIRSSDPLAIVVSGGLQPTDVNDGVGGIDAAQFLGGMYEAGAAPWFDALGVHLDGRNNPPGDTPDLATADKPGFKGLWPYYFRHYEALHETMLAHGDRGHSMWLTSVGWASESPAPTGLAYAADNSETDQARYLVGAAYQIRTQPYVQVMIVENFNLSVTEGPGSRPSAYSLIRADWTARPAFLALAKMRQADMLMTSGAEPQLTMVWPAASQ